MNLKKRSYTKELLDNDDLSFHDVQVNMKELNFINTWLGGHAITINGLRQLLAGKKQLVVCEIGCGGGDNLQAITRWASTKNIHLQLIGIDIKQACIDYAATKKGLNTHTQWICSDYKNVVFYNKPDVIFSSLFCHHFDDDALLSQLKWMKENASHGFFINDLHRHWLAYGLIKILTRIFSTSYLVKNDAPLSVARGFTKCEWYTLAQRASMPLSIAWKWAFRYLIIYRHER